MSGNYFGLPFGSTCMLEKHHSVKTIIFVKQLNSAPRNSFFFFSLMLFHVKIYEINEAGNDSQVFQVALFPNWRRIRTEGG